MKHLTLPLLLSAPALAWGETPSAPAGAAKPDLCLFLGDHWSYTGVGWTYGLASCVQSVTDCLDMADYSPSVKTGINLDAAAYPLIAASNPEVIARLRHYLAEGKVEIIGGTYGQPLGSMVSGESNIRQLVAGQQTIRETLGLTVPAFLEEEEFTHPQMPQLLRGSGYRYASTAQCNTWGKHGSPLLNRSAFQWQGVDGTCIPATPANAILFHPPVVTHDIDWLWSPAGREQVAAMEKQEVPLALRWVEFGWGPGELYGKTPNKFLASSFRELSEKFNVRYTTLSEYLREYGDQATERIQWRMDDFHKLLPWGCGGDQLRRRQREVEATLTAAERFQAAAALLGLAAAPVADLDSAWKHLLTSQSHDVSLCEYLDEGLDLAGINDPDAKKFLAATGTAEENARVRTWGDMGFRHLSVAEKAGQAALASALSTLSAAIDTEAGGPGRTAIVVFNSTGFARDALVTARGVNAAPSGEIVIRDEAGRVVPSQVLPAPAGAGPQPAEVLFQARQLPAFGYATYYVDAPKESPAPTDLQTSTTGWRLENALVSVELDAQTGAIARLVDRRTGLALIDSRPGAFPLFSGRPNRELAPGKEIPENYASAASTAEIHWIERGPLRATVAVTHRLPLLRLEYWISLAANSPQVDVRVRLAAELPPEKTAERVNGWQPPLHIPDGYWLSFAPAFQPATVIRDYPLGVEACGKEAIDTSNFLDLVGAQGGLLLVHSGTQYFKRSADGVFSNLIMRDWHSIFLPKSGWPREAEYRFALIPHGRDFTNPDRLRCVEQFDHPALSVVTAPHAGPLGRRRQFLAASSPDLLLTAFRRLGQGVYEARVVEQSGRPARGQLDFGLPVERYAVTNLLGETVAPLQPVAGGKLPVTLAPWEIRTLRIESAAPSLPAEARKND